MDISHDSKLIVTCSADKNVKIWGLDFGDCHKSIFAHDESVMQVAFEKDSHYFWTVSKDKMLKYWDGDKVGVFFSLVTRPINVETRSVDPGLRALRSILHSLRKSRPSKGITVRFGRSP
jgi:WD40 repeat protein